MSTAVAPSWRKSVPTPSAIPQNARPRTTSATTSAASSAPRASRCCTRGTSVKNSAMSTAPEASASAISAANARSARGISSSLRESTQGRAMRGVDGIELRGEGDERGVAELGDEAAREVARQPRAALLTRERRAVHVGLAVAGALEQALGVEPRHDRHDGRVRELAAPSKILDDVAHRRGPALPQAVHDLGLERAEELLFRLRVPAEPAEVGATHVLDYPALRPRTVTGA